MQLGTGYSIRLWQNKQGWILDMAELAALLFDVDGTLADTERHGHRGAFNRAFADAGLEWEWDDSLYGELLAVTGGKERILHYMRQIGEEKGVSPDELDEFVARLHAAKNAHYKRLLAEGGIPLRPGIERLLNEAREAGLRLAIATTTTADNVSALLHQTLGPEAESWFEVIGAGDVVPAKKPAPDIYRYVMGKMGLSPQVCVALEDSRHGLQAAIGTGLKTVVTVNDYTRHDDFPGAALVIDQVGEPERPFTVLSGSAGKATHLDLALLGRLLD